MISPLWSGALDMTPLLGGPRELFVLEGVGDGVSSIMRNPQ